MGGTGSHTRAKRGEVVGWSRAAVRRHVRWLYSVDTLALSGVGFALTLTLLDCPAGPAEWARLRDTWLKRVVYLGAIRTHWIVEWQRRGVPHLHAAVYFAEGTDLGMGARVVAAWLELAAEYGAGHSGQNVQVIDGPLGWLKYLSKHAARGVEHYQRQGKPEGWERTGRLWGHGGDWPTPLPIEATITNAEMYRLRRLMRSWRVADARAAALRRDDPRRPWRRLTYARRMLKCPDPYASRFRGVSEWIPQALWLRLLSVATSDRGDGQAAAGGGAASASERARRPLPHDPLRLGGRPVEASIR